MSRGRPKIDIQDCCFYDGDDSTPTHAVYKCRGEGCKCQLKLLRKFSLPTAKFIKHTVKNCQCFDNETKMEIAKHSTSKEIKEWLEHQQPLLSNTTTADNDVTMTTNNNSERDSSTNQGNQGTLELYQDEHGNIKRRRQTQMYNSIDRCCDDRADAINKAMNKFLVSNGTPCAVVGTESFKEMVGSLNKAYESKLPSMQTFRRKYLPQLYQDTCQKIAYFCERPSKQYCAVLYVHILPNICCT